MVEELRLEMLGGLRMRQGDADVARFVSSKAPALLCYLAVTSRPHFRAALAAMFWSELPETDARMNLRHVLLNLRHRLTPHLVITRDTVAFDCAGAYSLDVKQFVAAFQGSMSGKIDRLRAAVALYRGDFLEGFSVRSAPAFDEWVIAQRERLRQLALHALHELITYHSARQEYEAGIDYATRLLQLDPWREEAHRQLMRLLAESGQPGAGLQQYGTCRHILAEELRVEPDPETTALYEQIRAGTIQVRPTASRGHSLPLPPAPLLGREAELASLARLLQQPAVRLLTLVGPGGVGKTRLAEAVAAEHLGVFADGVFMVDLAPLRSPALVASTIGQALEVREVADQLALESVRSWLEQREVLLILDNFEHLLGAAPVVSKLLATCPRLKILVTSQATLHLRGEQEFHVEPLETPAPCSWRTNGAPRSAGIPHSAAVELFAQRAVNVHSDFRITPDNVAAVAEICYRLDGLPLAIELAAARVKLLSPHAILQRLDSRLSLLTGGARDLPARQRTLRDMLAWSYDLLPEEHQRLFQRLGVFVGGFTLDAAQVVCDVDANGGTSRAHSSQIELLNGVEVLIDKSLVRRAHARPGGACTTGLEPRFAMLETIREYALEHLAEAGEEQEMRRRHAQFFLARAEQAALAGPRQHAWRERLEADQDNLEAALVWSQAAAAHN